MGQELSDGELASIEGGNPALVVLGIVVVRAAARAAVEVAKSAFYGAAGGVAQEVGAAVRSGQTSIGQLASAAAAGAAGGAVTTLTRNPAAQAVAGGFVAGYVQGR